MFNDWAAQRQLNPATDPFGATQAGQPPIPAPSPEATAATAQALKQAQQQLGEKQTPPSSSEQNAVAAQTPPPPEALPEKAKPVPQDISQPQPAAAQPQQPDPAIAAAQQQALQEQQQYLQDLARLRAEQQAAQQQPFPQLPTNGQPATQEKSPEQAQPPKMPGQEPPSAQLPPTPPPPPGTQPLPTQANPLAQEAGPTATTPQAGRGNGQTDEAFYKEANQILVYGDPGHRWNAFEEISKRSAAPPETFSILCQTVKPDSPVLPNTLPDETKSRLRQAAFWTLALLNGSQNSNIPVIVPAKDPQTGQAQKDPSTGKAMYQMLPGLQEAEEILSNKKEDPAVQRAAVQMLQEIGKSHPNDRATLMNYLKKVKTNDPNVKALVKQGIPEAKPAASADEATPPQASPAA